eukprot:TRINITY_DN8775_c0_g1_i6.p1 TRINITY_DN8775_c0_g1~~TRINITY_DN8775_c0_g1_i6.p1  ORF type:complete len:246 (+),score=71.39 TRINITY_DN8775_c0_g1_i6:113-850(+)
MLRSLVGSEMCIRDRFEWMHRGGRDLELGHLLDASAPNPPPNPSTPHTRTCSFHDAADFERGNPHILSGYRTMTRHATVAACAKSAFELHNETGNIWTHLLAFGYALVLHERVQFSPKLLLHPHISWESAATMTAFLLSVECCFFFSVLFHTFKCRSGRASLALFQLDQLGIVLLVVCSFLPGLHLGFYCEPQLAFVYTAVILTALGIGVILVSVSYTHLRAHETPEHLVCRLLLEKKKKKHRLA